MLTLISIYRLTQLFPTIILWGRSIIIAFYRGGNQGTKEIKWFVHITVWICGQPWITAPGRLAAKPLLLAFILGCFVQVEWGPEAALSSWPSGHIGQVSMLCPVPWIQIGQLSRGSRKEDPDKWLLSAGSRFNLLQHGGKDGQKNHPYTSWEGFNMQRGLTLRCATLSWKLIIAFLNTGTFINKEGDKWMFLHGDIRRQKGLPTVGLVRKLWLWSWGVWGCLERKTVQERKN